MRAKYIPSVIAAFALSQAAMLATDGDLQKAILACAVAIVAVWARVLLGEAQ